MHGVLLAPLPVAEGDRLVWLGAVGNRFQLSVSIPNYYSWEDRNRAFETIGARRNVSFTPDRGRPAGAAAGVAGTRRFLWRHGNPSVLV